MYHHTMGLVLTNIEVYGIATGAMACCFRWPDIMSGQSLPSLLWSLLAEAMWSTTVKHLHRLYGYFCLTMGLPLDDCSWWISEPLIYSRMDATFWHLKPPRTHRHCHRVISGNSPAIGSLGWVTVAWSSLIACHSSQTRIGLLVKPP